MSRITAVFGAALLVGGLAGCHGTRGFGKGCCPNYGYCKPNPLPYTFYCGRPTPKALQHAAGLGEGSNPEGVRSSQVRDEADRRLK